MNKINDKQWTESNSLEEFLAWFISYAPSIGRIPFNNPATITKVGNGEAKSLTWYQSGPFQVQFIIMDPNTIVQEHTHPNMDSFELYAGGQINFFLNGKCTTKKWEDIDVNIGEPSPNRGEFIRVKPNDLHGGIFGPSGGYFFSIQKWQNGVIPKDVTEDWNGISYSDEHISRITTGKSILVNHVIESHAYDTDKFNLLN